MENQAYVILDLETGGLDCKINPITEIALIAVDSVTFKEITRFQTFVKPYDDLEYEEEALSTTGISRKDISLGMNADELVSVLVSLFSKLTPKGDRGKNFPLIVGHNIGFDIGFLKYLFKRVKKDLADYVYSSGFEVMCDDTLLLAKKRWLEGKHTLSACCKRVGVNIDDAHRAMNDVVATKKLYEYFVGLLREDKKAVKNQKISQSKDDGSPDVKEFREGFQF